MSRKGENIYRRKDGRWEGRYIKERVNGKACYRSVYAGTYREVKEKLNMEKKRLAECGESVGNNAGKVSKVSQKWLEEMEGTLKESSIVKYEDLLRCYVLPEFGNSELSEITNKQIIHFSSQLLAKGGAAGQGLAPATVLEVMSALNSMRIYALKRECRISFSPDCISIKREQKEIRVFSAAEESRLIFWLKNNLDLTNLGILLCLFTGIRLGEVCALGWDDLDLTENILHVRKTMQRIRLKESEDKKTGVRIFEPKSSCSVRSIPIPQSLTDLLLPYRQEGTFFLTGKKETFVEPRTLQNRFKTVLHRCGVEKANFHAIRHTFATRCVELGFDVKSLSEILGHASVAITMNRYVHPSMALKSENMARLDALFTVK